MSHNNANASKNVVRFKAKLAGLRRRTRFITWAESRYFAQELETMLENLEAGIKTPEEGLELVADFFKSDRYIFELCDDSGGYVGDVFRCNACSLFIKFANSCRNKNRVLQLLKNLYKKDDYGVRFCPIESASQYLSEDDIRILIKEFEKEALKYEDDSREKRHWQSGMQTLAEELKDAALFEKITTEMYPSLPTAICLDIAGVYLKAGDPKKALEWINKIPHEDEYMIYEKYELLLAIYQKLGDVEKSTEVAWILFRRNRTEKSLSQLLDVIGPDKRDKVLQDECKIILNQTELSLIDAHFLFDMGLLDEAAKYILSHREQLNGDQYGSILPLATGFEENKKYLAASILYRALLESILRRAQSKYYHHGVRYLKKLDKLSPLVTDWGDCISHQDYFQDLSEKHKRKSSFWGRYNK